VQASDQPPLYWIAYGAGLLGGALIVGLLVGLLPFFLARRYRQNKTAWFGLIACIVASLLGGIVAAAPTALAFIGVILLRRPKEPADKQASMAETGSKGDA
jgi:hypothetical protein